MSDLNPFRSESRVSLTVGARIIRGFTRIGLAVAILTIMIGVTITGFVANDSYSTEVNAYNNARCIAKLARAGFSFRQKYPNLDSQTLDYEVSGCRDSGIYGKEVSEVLAIADTPPPSFMKSGGRDTLGIGLLITGGGAFLAYVLFWMIGWVFAGFTRDG
ncbi:MULTISPECIES: hypothetical protein [Rhodopseudomonas]|uniref:hypothetical protein n=1 Tax=Rhodopseudomonas TaxID=1073 RepID=UPI0011C04454|nr:MULTISPECIES: hypothetical protein [Rhodopseudomonas]